MLFSVKNAELGRGPSFSEMNAIQEAEDIQLWSLGDECKQAKCLKERLFGHPQLCSSTSGLGTQVSAE